jgi:DNA-binding NarL/FixJ family response regulator
VLPAFLVLGDDPAMMGDLLALPVRAWGMIPLDSTAEEMIAAIFALHEGLIVAAPHLFKRGLQVEGLRLKEGNTLSRSSDLKSPRLQPSTFNLESANIGLTPRETQVLQLLAQGLANKQIARALGISEHTIKFHVSSIYGKLGVGNRTEAVRVGARQGLILL